MKWISVDSPIPHETYELWHDKVKLLTLISNPELGTARVETEEEKRMFLIEKAGFLRAKTIVRNEYGVRVGQLGYEKRATHEGIIELDDEQFFYMTRSTSPVEFILYKTTPQEPLVVCGLAVANEEVSLSFAGGHIANDTTASSLLMALCWHLFMPVTKEEEDYAKVED